MKNHFGSSVLVGDSIYGFDNATFRCVDAESGNPVWESDLGPFHQAIVQNKSSQGVNAAPVANLRSAPVKSRAEYIVALRGTMASEGMF